MTVATLPGAVVGLAGGAFEPTTAVLIALGVLVVVGVVATCVVGKEEPYRAPAERPGGNPCKATWNALKKMRGGLWGTMGVVFFGVSAYAPFQMVISNLCGVEVYGGLWRSPGAQP